MKILVAILNFHQHNLLVDLLNDLSNQSCVQNLDIYIGDVQPTNDEEWFINIVNEYKNELNLEYFVLDSNEGYAINNNIIIRKALEQKDYDYVLVSNPDIRIKDKLTLETLINYMKFNKNCSVIGPKVLTHEGRQQGPYMRQKPLLYLLKYLFPFLRYPFWKYSEYRIKKITSITPVWRIIGAFMLINMKDFQKINLFDEGTFLYWEEELLSWKLEKINKKVYYSPNVSVLHLHGSNGKKIISRYDTESMKYYFNCCGYSKQIIKMCEFSVKIYNNICKILGYE